jgi:hypothetical protein
MTELDGDGVVGLFRAKKAKRRPELTTTATRKMMKTRRVLRCLVGGCGGAGGDTRDGGVEMLVGGSVSGFGIEKLSGLMAVGDVEGFCLLVAGGVNVEGSKVIGGDEDGNEEGVKGAGVIPSGREGCSGL